MLYEVLSLYWTIDKDIEGTSRVEIGATATHSLGEDNRKKTIGKMKFE